METIQIPLRVYIAIVKMCTMLVAYGGRPIRIDPDDISIVLDELDKCLKKQKETPKAPQKEPPNPSSGVRRIVLG